MELMTDIIITLLATVRDVLPIAAILFGFQFLVLRRSIPHLKRVLSGFGFVLAGLALFLLGLEEALLSLIHISEPTRLKTRSRMPSSA